MWEKIIYDFCLNNIEMNNFFNYLINKPDIKLFTDYSFDFQTFIETLQNFNFYNEDETKQYLLFFNFYKCYCLKLINIAEFTSDNFDLKIYITSDFQSEYWHDLIDKFINIW